MPAKGPADQVLVDIELGGDAGDGQPCLGATPRPRVSRATRASGACCRLLRAGVAGPSAHGQVIKCATQHWAPTDRRSLRVMTATDVVQALMADPIIKKTYSADFDIVMATVFPVLLVGTGILSQYVRDVLGNIGSSAMTFTRLKRVWEVGIAIAFTVAILSPIGCFYGAYIALIDLKNQSESSYTQTKLLVIVGIVMANIAIAVYLLMISAYTEGDLEGRALIKSTREITRLTDREIGEMIRRAVWNKPKHRRRGPFRRRAEIKAEQPPGSARSP